MIALLLFLYLCVPALVIDSSICSDGGGCVEGVVVFVGIKVLMAAVLVPPIVIS